MPGRPLALLKSQPIDEDRYGLCDQVLPFRFPGGVASYKTAKGKDYFKDDTAEESLVRASLMVDVGQLAFGSKNTLLIGPGYEYWKHKYGAINKPGTDTYAPTVHLEWHF